jgi:hypothetical protein
MTLSSIVTVASILVADRSGWRRRRARSIWSDSSAASPGA